MAHGAVMIDAREPEVFERPRAERIHEPLSRRLDVQLAARDLVEEIPELFV